jgi:hypothetical protein
VILICERGGGYTNKDKDRFMDEIPKRYSRNINFIGVYFTILVHLTILLGDHIILNYRLYHLVENFAHLLWHPYSALCRFLGDHELIYFLKQC